jgi:hypothetical protein
LKTKSFEEKPKILVRYLELATSHEIGFLSISKKIEIACHDETENIIEIKLTIS